jgi:hypothetical protein
VAAGAGAGAALEAVAAAVPVLAAVVVPSVALLSAGFAAIESGGALGADDMTYYYGFYYMLSRLERDVIVIRRLRDVLHGSSHRRHFVVAMSR